MSSIHLEPEDLPDVAPHNHGRTRAAWVAMGGFVVGFLIASIGLAIPAVPLIWIGSVLCAMALAAGVALRALGQGQPLG